MNCNCTNNVSANNAENTNGTKIKHIFGNVFRLGIPLVKHIVSISDGIKNTEDIDLLPLMNDAPITVVFDKSFVKFEYIGTIEDGYIVVEDKGKLPIGTYSITVLATDNNGDPLRYKENLVLQIVDTTAEADYNETIDYDGWFKSPILMANASGGKGAIWQRELVWERSTLWYSRNN